MNVKELLVRAMSMKVKVLLSAPPRLDPTDLEVTIQQWLDANPGITIHSIAQSQEGYAITVTIVYS